MSQVNDELIEKLAHFEHESWNRWMKWLYQNGTWNDDGSFTINAEKAKRWNALADTPYADLDEPTKQYDRDEVEHILPAINQWAYEQVLEIIGNNSGTIRNGLFGVTHKDAAQNDLRAEQRQAAKTKFGIGE